MKKKTKMSAKAGKKPAKKAAAAKDMKKMTPQDRFKAMIEAKKKKAGGKKTKLSYGKKKGQKMSITAKKAKTVKHKKKGRV